MDYTALLLAPGSEAVVCVRVVTNIKGFVWFPVLDQNDTFCVVRSLCRARR